MLKRTSKKWLGSKLKSMVILLKYIDNIHEIYISIWYAYEVDAFEILIFQGLSAYRYGWRYLLFVVFLIFEVVK